MKGVQEPYPPEIQAVRRLPYGLKGFRRFARLLGLTIHPFQSYLLRFYFAGVTELVILIPKKNGKTTLLAALALYHLLMKQNAEAVIGAASREQAALLHRQATLLIEGAHLERRALPHEYGKRAGPTKYEGVFEVREGMHVIRFESGRLRVMPHEARTGDGVIPTLALVDELHRHPDGELYRVWRNGLLNGAQMITISTAGTSLDSALGRLLEKARTYVTEELKKRSTYTSPSGGFVLVEYALDPDDDRDDLRLVKQVNPAPWLTRAVLRERHPDNSPMESPGSWARLTCNVWTEGDEQAITSADWDPLYTDIGQIRDGDEVILAPSVGHNGAIGIAAMRGDRVAIRAEVLEAREGRSILVDVEDRIVKLCERYYVGSVEVPVGAFLRSGDLLAEQGIPVNASPHSPARLTAATGTFDRLRRSGMLMHDGDPVLRSHVLAGMLKVTEQGERYMISDRARGLIAVMMAVHAATAYEPEPIVVLPSGSVA